MEQCVWRRLPKYNPRGCQTRGGGPDAQRTGTTFTVFMPLAYNPVLAQSDANRDSYYTDLSGGVERKVL